MAHLSICGLCVCVCFFLAGPVEVMFGVWTRVGPRNHILDGDPDAPQGNGQFW